jgi:hypothetical protein
MNLRFDGGLHGGQEAGISFIPPISIRNPISAWKTSSSKVRDKILGEE